MAKAKKDELANIFYTEPSVQQGAAANNENEHLSKIVEEVYSKDDIELKTDLTGEQVLAISLAQTYEERFGVKILDKFTEKFMLLSVSKGRKGRKEFENITSSIYAKNTAEQEDKGIRARLIGKE